MQHYATIDAFFDCYSLPMASGLLSRCIKTADAPYSWKGTAPASVLHFTEKLQVLAEAAFGVVEQKDYLPEVRLSKTAALTCWGLGKYASYCGWHGDSEPWDFFPRHLSRKQFANPYKVFEQFTRYCTATEWKQHIKELASYALSPTSIHEFGVGEKLLGMSLHLHQLLEASHLIEVRNPRRDGKKRGAWREENGKSRVENGEGKENLIATETDKDVKQLSHTHIREFFAFFGRDGAQKELWETLKRALTNESDDTPSKDRSNMLFLYEQLTELLDSAWVVSSEWGNVKGETGKVKCER